MKKLPIFIILAIAVLLPYGDWGDVVIGSGYYTSVNNQARTDDPDEYFQELRKIGLLPSDGAYPKHNVILDLGNAVNPNIASNGLYDLILGYYNLDTNGDVIGVNYQDRLPSRAGGENIFNGNRGTPEGVTSRNIGGITSILTTPRKATDGKPNNNYIGNLTVPMANYLISDLGVSEFRNTNIIGDGDKWSGVSSNNNLNLVDTINVGLIGDYENIETFTVNARGVLDIKGKSPKRILQDRSEVTGRSGYLNLWGVKTIDFGVSDFYIVFVREMANINRFNKRNSATNSERPANVIIYPAKYDTARITSEIATLRPQYRAFIVNGTPKITGSAISGITADYVGSDPSMPIPSLVESDWEKFGNGDTTGFSSGVSLENGMPQLAPNYAGLTGEKEIYRMTQGEWDGLVGE